VSRKKLFLAVVLALLVGGLLEAALGLLAWVSPRVDRLLASPRAPEAVPPTVPDARFVFRPNPAYPGHDRNGFRNPEVPAAAQIVALGDSQTYGIGVRAGDAWPRQLEALTGTTIYSMAYGGYGPVHSLVLLDEAVALSPAVVIEALYAGNDLFDAFDLVYNRGQYPELRSADPEVQARARQAEQTEPIAKHVSGLPRMARAPVASEERVAGEGFSLQRLVAQHSKIYGLVRRALFTARQHGQSPREAWEAAKAFAAAYPASYEVFDDGTFRTVFTSEYRLSALDLGDPRIAEGLQISLRALQRMQASAEARDIRFLVVLIPTKEAVFGRQWQHPPEVYRRLLENEARVWNITGDFLAQNGIEYLDALPVLRGQLAAGLQPYPVSADGHLNEHGQRAIAELVAGSLGAERP
jgi:hypothetical protein